MGDTLFSENPSQPGADQMRPKVDPPRESDSHSGGASGPGTRSGSGGDWSSDPSAERRRDYPSVGSDYGYDAVSSGDQIHLLDYFRVLYKRRWIAVTSFLLVFLSTVVYTFTATPIYEAGVQILIENQDPNVVSFQEVLDQTQRTSEYYQTQYRILASRALARRTIDTLKVWAHPQFNPEAEYPKGMWNPGTLARESVDVLTSWVTGLFASARAVEPPEVGETASQSATIDRFLDGFTVAPIRNSRLVDVKFRSPDAVLAANVANALAKSYIEQSLEYKFLSSKEATAWLSRQLAEQRKQVEASERALQAYRERNDAVSLEDRQNIVVQKLVDLNAAVTRARTERIQKEAAYNQIRAVQNNRAGLDTLSAIVSNTFVQQQKTQLAELQRQRAQLANKLGPRHPDMEKLALAIETAQARIDAEMAKVIESLRNDYQQALAQERSLSAALDQQKGDALELNRKGIDYGVLARDAAASRQMFDSLMQRVKETSVSGELKTSNIRIVDEAEVPRKPASPRKGLNILLALFGGGMLGIGFAFFFEYLDNRIKNPDEIEQHLNLPFLGMVPSVNVKTLEKSMAGSGGSPGVGLANDGIPHNFAESFRALRTNVLFSTAEQGSHSIVVTSTGPSEGKTSVACNLAIALAQAGERVLLIDADLRKPRVAGIFGKPQKPGLSNVLVGNAKASEALHGTSVPRLWVMPAGVHAPNPPELLGSKRCRDFMDSLGEHFDWVIVDSPPVMAVTDAAVIAHRVTGVLFVIGSEMTTRGAARRAVKQLEHARAKFVGAVLNRVDLQHNAYYYSSYYRREYSDYYEQSGRSVG